MTLALRRAHARAMFSAQLESGEDEVPLDRCAAWMHADEMGCDNIDDILAKLDALSADLHIPPDANMYESVARLNHHLFTVHEFRGDTEVFDAPENSMLGCVLERRKGLPILLSLIYMEVARRHDVPIDAIGFPTHFLVQPRGVEPAFFVDPFHQGRVLRMDHMRTWFDRITSESVETEVSMEGWIRPIRHRLVLVRMNHNLKVAYMRRNDLEGALRTVERMLVLMPDALDVRRDRGLLRLELGQEEEGAADVDAYLAAQKRPTGAVPAYDE